jgi:uncharacterized protein YebE (UPF0316 family)
MIYLLIFLLKIIENMVSTLRILVLSNGNKVTSSILLFLTSIIWIISSSITIININLISVFVFSIGSLLGSYIGSILEEKIALGMCLIICISSYNIASILRKNGYIITSMNGSGMNGDKNIMFIVIKRKELKELYNNILLLDRSAIILKEYTNIYKNRQ